MNGQPAKVLRSNDVRRALSWVAKHRIGARNKTIFLLSVKAGLRAGEIAHLTWSMVTDSNGEIGDTIELPGAVAKYGSGRRLPLHEDIASTGPPANFGALVRVRRNTAGPG
jgi:integrase